jgi:diguanylate cyclase (GGDEF)-like protein
MAGGLTVLGAAVAGLAVGAGCTLPSLRRVSDDLAGARWLAAHDHLTGLPNRQAVHARFARDHARGCRDNMILLDLDGFKNLNDTWGHPAGDDYLIAVARRLAAACQDIGYPSRLGGDEFLVLLPGRTAAQGVHAANAMIDQISAPLMLHVGDGRIARFFPAASAGVAPPVPSVSWSVQLRHADVALYHAKQEQRGQVVLWADGMHQPTPRNMSARL